MPLCVNTIVTVAHLQGERDAKTTALHRLSETILPFYILLLYIRKTQCVNVNKIMMTVAICFGLLGAHLRFRNVSSL